MPRNRAIETMAHRALLCVGVAAALSAMALPGGVVAPSAVSAVVGRPATPASYAGVARRTSRRTTRRVVARTAPMTTLPAGCATAAGVYTCGGVSYREAYDGGTVVYVPIEE